MLMIERPERALIRMINGLNQLNPPLTPEEVEFGLPEVYLQGDTNSRVTLTMVDTRNYSGSDVHYYNRVRIADYFAGWQIPGQPGDYPNVKAAVIAMYTRYHLPLDPDDLVNASLSAAATQVTLQPRNDSLMFIPNLSVSLPYSGS